MLLSAIDFQLSDRVASFSWHDVTSLFSALYNRIVGLCGKIRHKLNNWEYNTPQNQKGVFMKTQHFLGVALAFLTGCATYNDQFIANRTSELQQYFADPYGKLLVHVYTDTGYYPNIQCTSSRLIGTDFNTNQKTFKTSTPFVQVIDLYNGAGRKMGVDLNKLSNQDKIFLDTQFAQISYLCQSESEYGGLNARAYYSGKELSTDLGAEGQYPAVNLNFTIPLKDIIEPPEANG